MTTPPDSESGRLQKSLLLAIAQVLSDIEWRNPVKIELAFNADQLGPYIRMTIEVDNTEQGKSTWTGVIWPENDEIQVVTLEDATLDR